jgi:hypothetical protein
VLLFPLADLNKKPIYSGTVVEGSLRGERRYDEMAGRNEREISSTWNSLRDGAGQYLLVGNDEPY